MSFALPIVLGGGLLAALFFGGRDEKKGGSKPAEGGGSDSIWEDRGGVLVVKRDKQPQVMASLAVCGTQPSPEPRPGSGTVVQVAPLQQYAHASASAAMWIAQQQGGGFHVLMSTTRPLLAAVRPGEEMTAASASRYAWGLIAEANASTLPAGSTTPAPQSGQPSQPSGFPIPGLESIPGNLGSMPWPFPPSQPSQQPPTQPTQPTQPGPTQPGVWTLPGGLGSVPWPFPSQPPSGGTIPASSTTPPAPPAGDGPPVVSDPATVPPAQPPAQPPGTVNIPGLGNVPVPPGLPAGLPGLPPAGGTTPPSGGATPPGTVQTSAGPWPSTHIFVIRPGDIASKIADFYTGNFMRAEELRQLNKLKKVGEGSMTQYQPWKVGQVLALPTDWDVSKGLPPVNTKALMAKSLKKKPPKGAAV